MAGCPRGQPRHLRGPTRERQTTHCRVLVRCRRDRLPRRRGALVRLCGSHRDHNCHTRIVGTRFIPPADFEEAYRKANRGTTAVEIPEVYELVNVVLALTATGQSDPNLVYQKSEYYQRVRTWFDRFRDHPVVAALDAELVRDPMRYFNLKMNGYSFEFDTEGRIVQSRVYDRSGSAGER